MQRAFKVIVIIAAIVPSAAAQSPSFYFDHISTGDGLANNKIYTIKEDHQGFIWIGTDGGLNRFDGIEFKTYSNVLGDSGSLRQSRVQVIYPDKKGYLWICSHYQGVDRLDLKTEKIKHFDVGGNSDERTDYNLIWDIYETNEGWPLFRSVRQSYKFDWEKEAFVPAEMAIESKTSISSEEVSEIISKRLGQRQKVSMFIELKNGNVLAAVGSSGLFKVDPKRLEVEHLSRDYYELNEITTMYEDRAGIIWIGTKNYGVFKYNPLSEAFRTFRNISRANVSKSDLHARALTMDAGGNLWVGTANAGVIRFNPSVPSAYAHYRHDASNVRSLQSDVVRSAYVDAEDVVWIGTTSGLSRYDHVRNAFENFELVDPRQDKIVSDYRVYGICEGMDGDLWIANWETLVRFDKRTKTFESYRKELFAMDNIRQVYLDDQNALWVGAEYGGLVKIDLNNFEPGTDPTFISYRENLSNENILSICKSQEGLLWIATHNGLNIVNPETNEVNLFDKGHLLTSSMIFGVVQDSENALWLTSPNGVSRISADRQEVETFNLTHGLQGDQFNESAVYQNATGSVLLLGGVNGISMIEPGEIRRNKIAPSVVLTGLQILNQDMMPGQKINGRVVLEQSIEYTRSIELIRSDRIVNFSFSALHYTSPHDNQYAYMLEGYDDDWVYVKANRRFATYMNLEPKDYVFKVKAANSDGVWNETPAFVNITVIPSWWETWWFQAFVTIVIVAGTFFFLKNRRDQAQRRQRELQMRLDDAVAEIKIHNEGLQVQNDNLKRSVDDTNFVIREAVDSGNFSARIETAAKEGAWKTLAESVNKLFDTIIAPFKSIDSVVNAMSRGDLSQRFDDSDKGEILALTQNFNRALDNLNDLLSQIIIFTNKIDESSSEMLTTSEEMNRSTSEIASSIGEMSNGAHNQVIKVDESSSLIETISKISREMGDKSHTINQVAAEGVEKTEKGLMMIRSVVENMGKIRDFSSETNTSMKVLTDRSAEIYRVLNVITDITAQTNLLALNAAIEAASAGEAGRGFAVVAAEIRKLAESSKASAKEIEDLVRGVQEDTSSAARLISTMSESVKLGVEASNNASAVFKEIADSSSLTLSSSKEILDAVSKQAQNIDLVVSSIENIVVIAEETAAGAEQIAASSTELSSGMGTYAKKARDLQQIANDLKKKVHAFQLKV